MPSMLRFVADWSTTSSRGAARIDILVVHLIIARGRVYFRYFAGANGKIKF